MKEEETVELISNDVFGKIKYVNALPRKKIIEKIEEVEENLNQYIKKAWENHIAGIVDTVAMLDLVTGKVNYTNYSPGWNPIFDSSIILFTISHDTRVNTDWRDIYDDEEFEEASEMYVNDEIGGYDEYAELKGIDLAKRFAVYLEPYIDEDLFGEHYHDLIEEVNKIYENKQRVVL